MKHIHTARTDFRCALCYFYGTLVHILLQGGAAMGRRYRPIGICVALIGLTIILITVLPSGALWFILGAVLICVGLHIAHKC